MPGPHPAQQAAPQWPCPPPGAPAADLPAGQYAAPRGRIWLDASYAPLAFTMGIFTLTVVINGVRVGAGWGRTPIDAPPGQHVLSIHVNYMWPFGAATAQIPVARGQDVLVFYRAPAMAFGRGAIGPTARKTPGVTAAILITAGLVAVMILLTIVLVLST